MFLFKDFYTYSIDKNMSEIEKPKVKENDSNQMKISILHSRKLAYTYMSINTLKIWQDIFAHM